MSEERKRNPSEIHAKNLCTMAGDNPENWKYWEREVLRIQDDSIASISQWRPISEAPKDGTIILAFANGYSSPFVSWFGNDAYEKGDIPAIGGCGAVEIGKHWCVEGCEDGDSTLYEPTHWMPLPPPPK